MRIFVSYISLYAYLAWTRANTVYQTRRQRRKIDGGIILTPAITN